MKEAQNHPVSGRNAFGRTLPPSSRLSRRFVVHPALQASVRHGSGVLCGLYLLCGVLLPFILAGGFGQFDLSPGQERLCGTILILLGFGLFAAYDAAAQRR